LPIALDATYSAGDRLSGVGVYCREILFGLAAAHGEHRFTWCYRPHRFFRSFDERLPATCSRFLLHDRWCVPLGAELFHGLNQRMPRRRFRRSVSTFHDLFVMTGEYSTPEFRARFTAQAREATERSDLIITVSAFTGSQVTELLGVEPGRIRVVHHGVHPPTAPEVPREPVVLHVGAIQHRKNIMRLVEAFERLPQPWRLVLAGSLGYGAEEILGRIANRRIELTGYVSADELSRLYRRASVFAFPSLDEGFGIPVLEAMSHGLPVLASSRPSLLEVCGNAALVVDPLSTDSIAEGLSRLTGDDDLRRDLARRGIEHAARFTWSAAVEKTWNVYRELLG
jgi:glycosyltransferase involved in cell wall biosynthesis